MKSVLVAPLGESSDALLLSLKESDVEKVILLVPEAKNDEACLVKKKIERDIACEIFPLSEVSLESFLSAFSKIKAELHKPLVVNVAAADRVGCCLAVAAAGVFGLKVLTFFDNNLVELPAFNDSYERVLKGKKWDVLRVLYERGSLDLEGLGLTVEMSLPLLSYHLNGTLKVKGLKGLGLVEKVKKEKGVCMRLTRLGSSLMRVHEARSSRG